MNPLTESEFEQLDLAYNHMLDRVQRAEERADLAVMLPVFSVKRILAAAAWVIADYHRALEKAQPSPTLPAKQKRKS